MIKTVSLDNPVTGRYFRLLTFCFVLLGTSSFAQMYYARVIANFPAVANGKTEWIDLDNDADLDLLIAGTDFNNAFKYVYENVGGVLTLRTTNLPDFTSFASADFDGDGDTDLLAFNIIAPFTKIFRNDGGFVFSESTSIGSFSPKSAVWFDVDNDQDLDFLLVGNMNFPRLFENTGTGFTELTIDAFPNCPTCTSDVADINGDGMVDIVFTGGVTALYLNAGNKTFQLDGTTSFKQLTQGDVACGDYDGDGDFDILLSGVFAPDAFSPGSPYTGLYENKVNKLVERLDLGLTAAATNSSSGLLWYNLNNDGKIDLFINGSTDIHNQFAGSAIAYTNSGSSFVNIQDPYLSNDRFTGSYDAGDFDNDGDMDLGFQGTTVFLEGDFFPHPVLHMYSGYYRQDAVQKPAVSNTKPLPPSDATFSATAYRREIRLKWGAGSDAETLPGGLFYNFYLRDANKKLIVPSVNFSNGNILTSNAPNGTGSKGFAFNMPEGNLYYAVQSIDGAKTGSVFSNEKTFYHMNGPESVDLTITDGQHVVLSWLDRSALETNFEILRSTSPVTGYSSVATLPANTVTYPDNFAFATETQYYYRIRGYNAQASVYDSLILVIPNRPINLLAQSNSAAKVTLTWQDQSQYETSYVIERKQGAGTFAVIATLGPDATSYDDLQVSGGTTYEYRVIAKSKNGGLPPITSVSITTNARPIGIDFEATTDEDKTLTLTSGDWTSHFTDLNPADKLTKFKIISLPNIGILNVYNSPAAVGQEVTVDLFDFVSYVPFQDYVGTLTFKVLPFDGKDYGDTDWTISLKFNQVNDPPTFTMNSPNVVAEDFTDSIKVYPQIVYYMGEENQVVTYSIQPPTSDIVGVRINPKTGVVALGSIHDKFGVADFTITANDGQLQNNLYTQKIKVTTLSVDDPPVFGPIANVKTDSAPIVIDLDIKDPDNAITSTMLSAFSDNVFVVRKEKILFNVAPDGRVQMTITPEPKLGDANISVGLNDINFFLTRVFKFSVLTVILGLEDAPGTGISVFPNPVLNELYIQNDQPDGSEIRSFHLIDGLGRSKISGTLGNKINKIDCTDFSSGLYFLQIAGPDGTIATRRIIKL